MLVIKLMRPAVTGSSSPCEAEAAQAAGAEGAGWSSRDAPRRNARHNKAALPTAPASSVRRGAAPERGERGTGAEHPAAGWALQSRAGPPEALRAWARRSRAAEQEAARGGRSRVVPGPGRAMRCVLIASTAAELLFYWADAAFLRRLRPPAATAAQVG